MGKVLITGALGQIGTDLTYKLKKKLGRENVVPTDIRENTDSINFDNYVQLDVNDVDAFNHVLESENITEVYHLAAMLSATAEKYPIKGWNLNTESLLFLLELAKAKKIKKIFWPSSIAVFGRNAPADNTPQDAPTNPLTLYGIAKVAGEQLCEYYNHKFGVDVRSVRYPGLISWKAKAGGGTTDYAVEIFYDAIEKGSYSCFLKEDSRLPMLYMEDAVDATIQLMDMDKDRISIHSSYNLGGLSFTPAEIATVIKKEIPDFEISYNPDSRQDIADTWPNSIDDSIAIKDWDYKPKFDLEHMTTDMLTNLKRKLNVTLDA